MPCPCHPDECRPDYSSFHHLEIILVMILLMNMAMFMVNNAILMNARLTIPHFSIWKLCL